MTKEITLIGRNTVMHPSGTWLEPRDYGATVRIADGERKYVLRLHETADLRDAPRIDVTDFVRAGHFLVVDK